MTNIRTKHRGRNNAITKEEVAHVKALLVFKVPRKEIRERVGLSLESITKISTGRLEVASNTKYVRCKTCGGKVSMPCMLCTTTKRTIKEEDEFIDAHVRFALAKHFDITEDEVTPKSMLAYRDREEVKVDGVVLLVFIWQGEYLKAQHSER